jgi:translation initiation factor IF-2
MSAVRIYDLAKELRVSNNDLLEILKGMGESVKTASSTIPEEAALAVRNRIQSPSSGNGASPAASSNGNSSGAAPAPVASQAPSVAQPSAPAAAWPVASQPAPAASAPAAATPAQSEPPKTVDIPDIVSLKDFADLIGVPAPNIQKKLMALGVLASLNQKLSPEVVTRLAKSYGVPVNIVTTRAPKVPEPVAAPAGVVPTPGPVVQKVAVVPPKPRQKPAGPMPRPPVVTIMGHVDHGKTTLLDAIRKAKVADSEFGGITQHVGAYQVEVDDPIEPGKKRKITFLDTPGHEAFTAMRARGAQVTDIAILVVAADDGVMPQTVEALNHARAAQVPIIVAVNKIDKEDANPTRVLTQLTEHNLMPEAYGGDVQTVEVSAKEELGLDDLLEKILLVSDAEVDPKADPSAPAVGVVIEAELDRGRGPVATILVEQGTVKMGDSVVVGSSYGRIKAMFDDRGQRVQSAGPAQPVVILGMNSVPGAGDRLEVVKNERAARQIADERADTLRDDRLTTRRPVTLEDLQRQIKQGSKKELNVIIKGDVQGSVEAIRQSLEKVEHPEVKVRFISSGVGAVGESDVLLASASEAIVLAFNTRVEPPSIRLAESEHVEIREYRIIYDLIDDVKLAMAGLLDPIYEEAPLGKAEVRALFKLPKQGGVIAGSYILDGKILRGANARIVRNGKVVYEGKVDSIRREKDDVREVATGYECGIFVPGYDPVEGDIIECYEMKRITRTL